MSDRGLAAVNAAIFFVFWLGVLYAGADHPPPPGFLLLVGTVALCAGIVYWRVPTYLSWYRIRRSGRLWRVLADGFIAGVVLAFLFILLPGGGEPSVTPTVVDRLIWFGVVGVVGMVNSAALYGVNASLLRIVKR